MTIHLVKSPRSQAVLQRLVWRRGHATTWKTIQIFSTKKAAVCALRLLPLHLQVRVLSGVPEAAQVGALTRDVF